eukprot:363722-Chlamydomonas_euryale.AAC.7
MVCHGKEKFRRGSCASAAGRAPWAAEGKLGERAGAGMVREPGERSSHLSRERGASTPGSCAHTHRLARLTCPHEAHPCP